MAQRNQRKAARGNVTERPPEATQTDNSKDSFNVLIVSMILAIFTGVALLWYFDVLPWHHRAR